MIKEIIQYKPHKIHPYLGLAYHGYNYVVDKYDDGDYPESITNKSNLLIGVSIGFAYTMDDIKTWINNYDEDGLESNIRNVKRLFVGVYQNKYKYHL